MRGRVSTGGHHCATCFCPRRLAGDRGRVKGLSMPPQVRDGRTLVPFRALAESLGVTVFWDEAERAVRANDGQTKSSYRQSTDRPGEW